MFINYYTPSQGGMETSLVNLCIGLEKAGHETFIFAPKYPNWQDKAKNIFRYRSFSFKYDGYLYVIPVPFLSQMYDEVKKLGLDVIHSHQPYSLGGEAMKFSKDLGIPIVLTYHIKYEDYSHYIPFVPEFVSKPLIKKIVSSYSNKCDAVISPSTAIKKLMIDDGVKAKIEVIPSGIDIENFGKNRNKRNSIREKYKIKPEEIVLITASRIASEKNIGFLIKSFSLIKKTFQNVKFFVVGEGADRKKIEAMVRNLNLEKDVIFTGLVSKEEIINFYQASDIFVFSSLTETQGLVAVEAMSAGLPVVAIRASGIEDIVNDGENGFLVPESPGEFSRKVLQIIEDKNLREKLSYQAKINSGRFTIEVWAEKMVKLYRDLILRKNT